MWRQALLFVFFTFPATQLQADDALLREANLPSTSIQRLYSLAQQQSWHIRRAVAGNRRSPSELLQQLATDPDLRIRIAVATNLSSPESIHMLMVDDTDKAVRSVVARFEYVSARVLDRLARDADADIRYEVAGNWNTAPATLKYLRGDTFEQVRQRAQQELDRR
ncbi:MAG: hypothetical protein OEX03_08095 [Gammaproteobacteria bacterium]|nr:hypothetical protein [Gammaproteobacteria bacterium]